MRTVSMKLVAAVKLSPYKGYEIAQMALVTSPWLSGILTGNYQPKPGDAKVARVCKVLGLDPAEAFEVSDSKK